MSEQEALAIFGAPEEKIEFSNGITISKFSKGILVTEKSKVKEALMYKTFTKGSTIFDLVQLGNTPAQIIEKAGWPLGHQIQGSAVVFYYRTGTLLIKDYELINTFNRSDNYGVSVSSYKGIPIKDPIYYVVPSVVGIDRNSLEFIEAKSYIEYLLSDSGGKVTDNLKDASVLLFVNFGVGDKQVDIMTYSTPIYDTVYNPGTTSTTNVQNQYGQNVGSFQTSTPGSFSTRYAGQSSGSYRVESFRRHLILEAIHLAPFKSSRERKYFWKITAESIGSSGDFREILPVLSYASSGYVNKNSGKSVRIAIDFDQMMNYFLEVYSK